MNLILVDQEVEEDLAALAALVIEVEEVTTRDQLEGVVVNLNFQVWKEVEVVEYSLKGQHLRRVEVVKWRQIKQHLMEVEVAK